MGRIRRDRSLFVGVTSWNSEALLDICLESLRRTTVGKDVRIVVLDNASHDSSTAIARRRGAEVVVRNCTQAEALNRLFAMSRSEFTLLAHADVVFLSETWLDLCLSRMVGDVVLVSPEDIGCGPYSRMHGKGMPESSFLLFRTEAVRKARRWFSRRRFRVRWPYRAIDFFGEHVTYRLPQMLSDNGMAMSLMAVHTSDRVDVPIYTPGFKAKYWRDELGFYRYGLGNFYSIDGVVTHYHNWLERVVSGDPLPDDSEKTFPEDDGIPVVYVQKYTQSFVSDYRRGAVVIPATLSQPPF